MTVPPGMVRERISAFADMVTVSGGVSTVELLAGDGLMVLTRDTFDVVDAGPAMGDSMVTVANGCGGPCTVRFADLVVVLAAAVSEGTPVRAPLPAPGPLAVLPSVTVSRDGAIWRVTFDERSTRLVAVEYYGPFPLPGQPPAP